MFDDSSYDDDDDAERGLDDDFVPIPQEERREFVYAHEDLERELDSHTLLCACRGCAAAMERTAIERPRFVFALKTGADRLLVTAEYLMEVKRVDRSLRSLLYVEGDYIRDIYVPSYGYLWGQRWWSLTFKEDCEAVGRKHPRSKVARRQSKAAVRRRNADWEAQEAAREAERKRLGLPEAAPLALTPLADAVAGVRREHHAVIAAAAAWAVARGSSLDLDVLAAVIAGTGARTRFTRTRVGSDVTCRINNWCAFARVMTPDNVPETLWLWLNFLAETGRLDPDSDPLPVLLWPFGCMGLDDRGERIEDDREIECRCYVEYDGPTHGESIQCG